MRNPIYESLRKAAAEHQLDETTQLLTIAGYLVQLNIGLNPEKFTDAAATFCQESGLPADNFIYLLTCMADHADINEGCYSKPQVFDDYLAAVCKAYEAAMQPVKTWPSHALESKTLVIEKQPYQLEFFANETMPESFTALDKRVEATATVAPPAVKAVPKELRVVNIELPIKRDEYDVIADLLDRTKTPGPMACTPIGADLGKWVGSVKEEPTLSFIAMVVNAEAGPWLDAFLTDGVNICGSPRPTTDLSKPLIVRYKDTEYRAHFKLI